MLQAARVKPGEMVYDLGSGDGRIVITAAQKFGARAVGVEIDPVQCRKAMERVKSLGLADMVSIVEDSALRIDLRPADVVTMFFLTLSNERLKPNFEKQLKQGARVVSTEFPDQGLEADRSGPRENRRHGAQHLRVRNRPQLVDDQSHFPEPVLSTTRLAR